MRVAEGAGRLALERGLLVVLALSALAVGVPALIAPHAFFAHWPYFSHWVGSLPPYNEHLTSDVGELEVGFGLLFAGAAWRPRPALVVPVCLAWAITQLIHTAFHATHLRGLPPAEEALELAALSSGWLAALGVAISQTLRARQ